VELLWIKASWQSVTLCDNPSCSVNAGLKVSIRRSQAFVSILQNFVVFIVYYHYVCTNPTTDVVLLVVEPARLSYPTGVYFTAAQSYQFETLQPCSCRLPCWRTVHVLGTPDVNTGFFVDQGLLALRIFRSRTVVADRL
jgi:hypothetical protein